VVDRRRVPTAAPWARTVAYSRAVRVGDRVWVSGTAAVDADGRIQHVGDAYGQAQRCLEIIAAALSKAGATAADVVRTRVYLRDASDWEAVGRAHGEVFAGVEPASTMVVAGLVHPDMLVEIEADAVLAR
jgi:enamine deaminase RidA (YjgF/YER057c/UK114 family)